MVNKSKKLINSQSNNKKLSRKTSKKKSSSKKSPSKSPSKSPPKSRSTSKTKSRSKTKYITIMDKQVTNLIIIGSGPAAYTAAIYAARANLEPILLEGKLDDNLTPGGQLTTTTDIENFPGFPDAINGYDLVENMKNQAVKFGTKVFSETVKEVDLSTQYKFKLITTDNKEYICSALIIATGATAKTMEFPGSKTYWMNGISACAVCDGAIPIFRNQPLAVIGGGDSALEEATFLTRFASMVYIIHRRNELRASKIMQNRALKNPKITFIWDTEVLEAHGKHENDKKWLNKLILKNNKTNIISELHVTGLFYGIGHTPASKFLNGQLATDQDGYIITKPGTTQTSIKGVFAAGDVQDRIWRQAITAAGTGCMAALEAEHYLVNHS